MFKFVLKVANVFNNWGYFVFLNWLPTYYLDRFRVDIKHLGYFTGKCCIYDIYDMSKL